MPKLSQLGEFGLIDTIARLAATSETRGVSVGIGDDAAVVSCTATTLLTTDVQREGVHFERDWLSARQLGRRAFRVAVSDVAAMAGRPRYVLLAFGAPAGLDAVWARRMIEGLIADARGCGAALVGGNVSADEKVSLVVSVVADGPHRPLLRRGARAGDSIWVTGSVGAAAAGVELLRRGVRRSACITAYRTPPLRLTVASALGAAEAATSMIDVSDGLVQDLAHVCRASDVTACLDVDAVPIASALASAAKYTPIATRASPERRARTRTSESLLTREALSYALAGGDDYELVFTSPARVSERRIVALCARHGCRATRIGKMSRRSAHDVVDTGGRRLDVAGYDHYQERS